MKITVESIRSLDKLGEPESLTFDLIPLVADDQTAHLDENGLPKMDTVIKEGMIIIGKIGKTECFDPARRPTCLELHGSPISVLREKYGDMWEDTSLYATPETTGRVVGAVIYRDKGVDIARVIIDRDPGHSA